MPLEIVLKHEEGWMHPHPNMKGKQLPSAKYTTKYYCVKRSCIMERLSYFSSSTFLKVSSEVRSKGTQFHSSILQQEHDFDAQQYSVLLIHSSEVEVHN